MGLSPPGSVEEERKERSRRSDSDAGNFVDSFEAEKAVRITESEHMFLETKRDKAGAELDVPS